MSEDSERKFDLTKMPLPVNRSEFWDVVYSHRAVLWALIIAVKALKDGDDATFDKNINNSVLEMDKAKEEIDSLVYLKAGGGNV